MEQGESASVALSCRSCDGAGYLSYSDYLADDVCDAYSGSGQKPFAKNVAPAFGGSDKHQNLGGRAVATRFAECLFCDNPIFLLTVHDSHTWKETTIWRHVPSGPSGSTWSTESDWKAAFELDLLHEPSPTYFIQEQP